MTDAPAVTPSPQATAPGVRAQIAAGDVAAARPAFEALRASLSPIDMALTESLLHEAEGDLEASLAILKQALASHPRSVPLNAQSARTLVRLERLAEAEAAAGATLALDSANIHALTALAFAYAKTGRAQESLDVVCRLAVCPGSSASAVWNAIGELSAAGRWADILQILDERVSTLEAKRARAQRVDALLELDRQRDALAALMTAYGAGDGQPRDMIDHLIARRALAVAADFIRRSCASEPGVADLRAAVASAARSVHEGSTLEAAPLAYADAARALEILLPDEQGPSEAVVRSAAFLIERAQSRLAQGDHRGATDYLIGAGRLAPTDRAVLEMLAEAALRADCRDRYVDTLFRLHRAHPGADTLTAAVTAAIGAGRWGAVGELMSRAPDHALDVAPGVPEATDRFRRRLQRRLEDCLRRGDCVGGLELVSGVRPWMTRGDWPTGLIARLLAAAKRLLRSPRMSTDTEAVSRLSSLYLALDPDDADVRRLVARLHLRHRRFGEAAQILAAVVRADPHLARDWADLALALGESGEPAERDACMARALVIAPTSLPAKALDQFWARMATAPSRKRGAPPSAGGEGHGEWVARSLSRVMLAIRADDADEVHAVAAEVIELAPEATALVELAAEFAARKEDWVAAVRYRAAVSAANPEDRLALVALVRALTRAGATAAALDLVDRLLEQAPIGAGYRRLRLEVLLADGSSEAVTNLCRALMETPADDTAGFVVDVAQILAQAEDLDRARAWIEAGQTRHEASGSLARLAATLAYRQARWEDAAALWNQLAQSDDQNTIREARVFRARIAAATDRNEDATRLYSEVLEDDPGNERAARHVVRQAIAAGRLDEAHAALERLEARVGRTPLVIRLRAMLAMGRRDSATAVAEYQQGIAEHPRDIELRCRLADLYDDLGDYEAMDAMLRGGELLSPQDPRVLSRQLTAGAARGLAPRRLLALADRLLAVRPGDQGVLRQKANLLIRLGERHEAVTVLLSALEANLANVSLWTSACSNLLILNENQRADDLLKRARAVFAGETARDFIALAEVLEASDRGDEAAAHAELAVAAEPDMGEARLLAARLWENRGLYRRAWPHLLAVQDLEVGRMRAPLTFARVARALHYVDAHPAHDAEGDLFPDAVFDRMSRAAVRRRFVEAEPLALHVTSSLAAGGSERQVAMTVRGLAATPGALRPELVVQDMSPVTGRDFFLPAVQASGVAVSTLRELRGEGVVRELFAQFPSQRPEISLLSALPTEVANVALPLYALILERRPRAVHLWQDAIIIAGGIAALLAGVPHIVLATRSTRPIERQRARPYLKAGYHALLRYPGTTMLNNSLNGARDYAHWLGIDPGQIQTLYNGFIFDELRARANPTLTSKIRRQLGAGRDEVVIGGVMRCSFEKRPDLWADTVIALAKANPRIRGLLVGEGPMRAELQARVEAQDLAGRVQFVGRQTPIEPWMRAMDILFLSSVTEGLPNVLIEAQALGVAAATLRVGGAPETVRENETSLVIDEGAVADIAAALAPLALDAGMRRRFGAAGVAWTEATFSLDAAIARLGDIYADR